MYVDYSFYSETYRGSIAEEDFARLEPRAEAYIEYLTLKDCFSKEDSRVKFAVCRAVEIIFDSTATSGASGLEVVKQPVKSETIDGYSVSYGGTDTAMAGETAEDILLRKILHGVRAYLLPAGLLYRGLSRC